MRMNEYKWVSVFLYRSILSRVPARPLQMILYSRRTHSRSLNMMMKKTEVKSRAADMMTAKRKSL